jgi:hypothetical protein
LKPTNIPQVAISADGTVRVVSWSICLCTVNPDPDMLHFRNYRPHFAQANERGIPLAEPSVVVWIEEADCEQEYIEALQAEIDNLGGDWVAISNRLFAK